MSAEAGVWFEQDGILCRVAVLSALASSGRSMELLVTGMSAMRSSTEAGASNLWPFPLPPFTTPYFIVIVTCLFTHTVTLSESESESESRGGKKAVPHLGASVLAKAKLTRTCP